MTVGVTAEQATGGGAAGVLEQLRAVFHTGRTRDIAWRRRQLRGI